MPLGGFRKPAPEIQCTHQLLVYADGGNILGGNTSIIKKNMVSLIVASNQFGL